MRNGCHTRKWSTLEPNADDSSCSNPAQIRPLKGTGSPQMADVIEWVFRATACTWDAMCAVIHDTPDRMNCNIMVNMKACWIRQVTAIPRPLGGKNRGGT